MEDGNLIRRKNSFNFGGKNGKRISKRCDLTKERSFGDDSSTKRADPKKQNKMGRNDSYQLPREHSFQ